MAMTPTGIARTVGLWVLIIAIAGSATLDFIGGNSIWGFFKLVVASTVGIYEVYYYVRHGKTISTKYKDFIIKHPLIGYSSLALMALAFAGLILHLAVW